MKPTPFQWLLASRYTLPFWVALGVYLYVQHGWRWEIWSDEQKLVMVLLGAAFAAMYLHSFPPVLFYEREAAAYRRSVMSPEERWQRATVRQTFFLVLVAIALLYFGLQWWKSTPEPQPATTKAALSIGGAGVLATTAYVKVKAWRSSRHEADQPAIVSCCLPVPTHSPSQQEIVGNLPKYCRQVLAAGDVPSPAHGRDVHKEAEQVPYGLA